MIENGLRKALRIEPLIRAKIKYQIAPVLFMLNPYTIKENLF